MQTPTSRFYSKGNTLKFWPKVTQPIDLSLMVNCGQIVKDSEMVTLRSILETTIALSNGTIDDPIRHSLPSKWGSKMHASWDVEFRMAISLQGIIGSTSCFVLEYGFRGRRIEWRYFQFDQIQHGSRPPSWKITAASCGFPATAQLPCYHKGKTTKILFGYVISMAYFCQYTWNNLPRSLKVIKRIPINIQQ